MKERTKELPDNWKVAKEKKERTKKTNERTNERSNERTTRQPKGGERKHQGTKKQKNETTIRQLKGNEQTNERTNEQKNDSTTVRKRPNKRMNNRTKTRLDNQKITNKQTNEWTTNEQTNEKTNICSKRIGTGRHKNYGSNFPRKADHDVTLSKRIWSLMLLCSHLFKGLAGKVSFSHFQAIFLLCLVSHLSVGSPIMKGYCRQVIECRIQVMSHVFYKKKKQSSLTRFQRNKKV